MGRGVVENLNPVTDSASVVVTGERALATRQWLEQWERVKRKLDRVRVLARGRPMDPDMPAALDEYLDFFIHCFQLKDWLKNDGSISVGDAESYLRGSASSDFVLIWPTEPST
jgi:hypothetical protein